VLRAIGKIVRLTCQRIRVQGEGFDKLAQSNFLGFRGIPSSRLPSDNVTFDSGAQDCVQSAVAMAAALCTGLEVLLGGFGSSINRAFCKIGKLFICAFFFGEGGVEERHGLLEAKFLRPGL
jgi:hypothetical protein